MTIRHRAVRTIRGTSTDVYHGRGGSLTAEQTRMQEAAQGEEPARPTTRLQARTADVRLRFRVTVRLQPGRERCAHGEGQAKGLRLLSLGARGDDIRPDPRLHLDGAQATAQCPRRPAGRLLRPPFRSYNSGDRSPPA